MPKHTATAARRRGDAKLGPGPRAIKDVARQDAAALIDGLDPLDRERASSLADEGGTAGAAVEARPPRPATETRRAAGKLWLAALAGLAGLAALYLRRSR